MALVVPVQMLALADIPMRLQQMMVKNRDNSEKTGIWEFLLWVRDVERVVHAGKITRFVDTYQLKTKTAKVDGVIVDFSTTTIGRAFALPDLGSMEETLPDLTKAEAEHILVEKGN